MAMRKGVDYTGVGVGAVVFSSHHSESILFALRGKKVRNEAGTWEMPGGGLKFGEKLQDAVIREMREELGIDVAVLELLGIVDHFVEGQHWVSPIYTCRLVSGVPTIREPEKCDAIGWMTIAQAERLPLSIPTQKAIAMLKEKYS